MKKGMQTESTPGLFNRLHCDFDMVFFLVCDGFTDSYDETRHKPSGGLHPMFKRERGYLPSLTDH